METLKANKTTIECKDSFSKISLVRGALSTAGLKNMLDGYRIQPISTLNNLSGYREGSVISKIETNVITGEIKTKSIFLEEDDVYYYDYDKGRLYQAVLEIFHKSLLFLVPTEIEENDGVTIYNKIMNHLNGQRGRDVDIARDAFHNYSMNENLTFKQERAKFEDVFKTLEYAQKSLISESDKIQFLTKRMILDKRIGLKDVMVQSRCNDFTYEKTVKLLIKVNCEMSQSNQTVKMAGMYPPKNNNPGKKPGITTPTTPIKYCYNFNESGECKFGTSCIYSHLKDPNHVTREPRQKPISKPTSQPSKPVSRDDRTPNGGESYKVSYKNNDIKMFSKDLSS